MPHFILEPKTIQFMLNNHLLTAKMKVDQIQIPNCKAIAITDKQAKISLVRDELR